MSGSGRPCSKHFTNINSFNYNPNQDRGTVIIPHFTDKQKHFTEDGSREVKYLTQGDPTNK